MVEIGRDIFEISVATALIYLTNKVKCNIILGRFFIKISGEEHR